MRRLHLMTIFVFAVFGLAAGASSAGAATWRIVPSSSSIRFSSTQMGEPLKGEFQRFDGKIEFDSGSPPQGKVRIEVDIASIKTGAADRDKQALGSDWFAARKRPTAVFSAQQFRRTGADSSDSYEAIGVLEIKDTSIPVTLPFTLRIDGSGLAEMHAQLSLNRLAFGLGAGSLSDPSVVAHDVAVDITLRAQRAD
jgi:polyisoprenoid-binding protein YceI